MAYVSFRDDTDVNHKSTFDVSHMMMYMYDAADLDRNDYKEVGGLDGVVGGIIAIETHSTEQFLQLLLFSNLLPFKNSLGPSHFPLCLIDFSQNNTLGMHCHFIISNHGLSYFYVLDMNTNRSGET